MFPETHLTPSPLCSPITTCTTYLYLSRFNSGRWGDNNQTVECKGDQNIALTL